MNDNSKDDPLKQLENIPWYQSRVLRALIVSGVSQIMALLQSHGVIKVTPDIDLWTEVFFQSAALVSAAYAFYSRSKHATPPVSLTKASAADANANNPNLTEILNANPPTPLPHGPTASPERV